MKVKAYAKLNLTLNVLGALDGFHVIDSVAASVDIFDVVEVTVRNDRRVTVSGVPAVSNEQNTAYKAACAFTRQFNSFGVDIAIEKRIPFGAGMGGSSADASAVIYCMCMLFGVNVHSDEIHSLCASIGSDVNFMLRGGLAQLCGKGDDLTFGKLYAPWYFALTTFDASMSTARVYCEFDKIAQTPVYANNAALLELLGSSKLADVAQCFNNHLQPAVASLSDYAASYLQFCLKQGFTPNMTGSGSAYYVPFVDELSAQSASSLLNANGFKTTVCKSTDCGIEILSL